MMRFLSVLTTLTAAALGAAFVLLGALRAGGTVLMTVTILMFILLGLSTLCGFWLSLWFSGPNRSFVDPGYTRPRQQSIREIDDLRQNLRRYKALYERAVRQKDHLQAQLVSQSVPPPISYSDRERAPSRPMPETEPLTTPRQETVRPDTGPLRAHAYRNSRAESPLRVARSGSYRNGQYR